MIGLVLVSILWFQGAPAAQTRNAIVAGQLRALDGSPAVSVRVAALPLPTGNAIPADGPNYYSTVPPASTALTDNQGRYRLENVPPGRYYIMAGLVGEPTYYPGAATTNGSQAMIITVGAGATTENLDFKLLSPIGRRVSGRVNQSGGAVSGQMATLSGSKLEELLRVPVDASGAFEFGRVQPGSYLLGLFPFPPGLIPMAVRVGDADVTGLAIVPPPTRRVTGRIVTQNGGPIPSGLLGFYTIQSYVGATINPDGTFSVMLHSGRHRADIAGMPVGYSLASARLGSADASQGFDVGNADVSGIVVTVAGPSRLPRVRGQITGLSNARLSSTTVELAGPIIGTLQVKPQQDGSFEFPAVIPGLYEVKLLQISEFTPIALAVLKQDVAGVQLTVPTR